MLAAAMMACTATEKAAAAACVQANPGGGAGFYQCLTTEQANAFACRQAALDAAGPGLAACTQQYLACVRVCPAA
jgi:hypothetical protein